MHTYVFVHVKYIFPISRLLEALGREAHIPNQPTNREVKALGRIMCLRAQGTPFHVLINSTWVSGPSKKFWVDIRQEKG